jgi:hypothetical protein
MTILLYGSVARAQLALLDPKGDAPEASNTYIRSLAGDRLSLTDAPCGAGAAAFAFLANIAELRTHDVLPRQPLDIFVIGAEPSSWARAYAEEVLAEIRPLLNARRRNLSLANYSDMHPVRDGVPKVD